MFADDANTHLTITKICSSPIRKVPKFLLRATVMFGDSDVRLNFQQMFVTSLLSFQSISLGKISRMIRWWCSWWSSFFSFERETMEKNSMSKDAHWTLFNFLLKDKKKRKTNLMGNVRKGDCSCQGPVYPPDRAFQVRQKSHSTVPSHTPLPPPPQPQKKCS